MSTSATNSGIQDRPITFRTLPNDETALQAAVKIISTLYRETLAELSQERLQASKNEFIKLRFSFSKSAVHPCFVTYCDLLKTLKLDPRNEALVNRDFLRNLANKVAEECKCDVTFGSVSLSTFTDSTYSDDLTLYFHHTPKEKNFLVSNLGTQRISKDLFEQYKNSEGRACLSQPGYPDMIV